MYIYFLTVSINSSAALKIQSLTFSTPSKLCLTSYTSHLPIYINDDSLTRLRLCTSIYFIHFIYITCNTQTTNIPDMVTTDNQIFSSSLTDSLPLSYYKLITRIELLVNNLNRHFRQLPIFLTHRSLQYSPSVHFLSIIFIEI